MEKPPLKYRLFEIMPGAAIWSALFILILFSFLWPVSVVIFIILYDLFWLFRIIYFSVYLIISWNRYKTTMKTDWLALVSARNDFSDFYHLIFLPVYNEDYEIIRPTFEAIAASRYPKNRMIVVLTGEERGDKEKFLANAEKIRQEFGDEFFKFLVVLHPANLPGEKAGKGSNTNYAGHKAKELIDELMIPYEKIIVSSFDIDTIIRPQYFAYLTYKYITSPEPTRRSFQPIAVYANNIWTSSVPVRIVSFGTTFWLMNELMHPERVITFSSHSMSFKALVDVGFWDKTVVSEDSRIFLQCLIKYHGKYQVEPLHMPVYMNTVMTKNYWESLKNLYRQQRRWAWGVENIPYMLVNFAGDRLAKFSTRLKHLFFMIEGMFSWAAAPILIFALGRLPLYVAGDEIKKMVFIQNAPYILEDIMRFAMLGIFLSAALSFVLLPPKPKNVSSFAYATMILQWFLLPVTILLFSALPAIDAQTRLMFGKRMGFWVSPKARF